MDEKKFDEMMDRWAAREIEKVPEIRPAPQVYRKLEESVKGRGRRPVPWTVRWAAVGLAGAAIVLFIVLRPSRELVQAVALREGFGGEKAARAFALKEEKPAAGEALEPAAPAVRSRSQRTKDETGGEDKSSFPKKGEALERVVFEYQLGGTPDVLAWDIAAPGEETLVLSAEDNYRLAIDLPVSSHVSVFQIGPGDSLTRLFPAPVFSSAGNPLRPGPTLIPAPPNWFHPARGEGEAAIYVVFSGGPNAELEDLLERYSRASKARERGSIRDTLIAGLERLRESLEKERAVLVFRFRVRQ